MNTRIATVCTMLAALAIPFAAPLGGCASTPAKDAASKRTQTRYAFWPVAPDEPRIQFIGAFNSSEDIAPTKTSNLEKIVFGDEAVKPAYVNKPYGVAVKDGKIYVCDIRAKAVVVMDLAKKQTRLVGVAGSMRLERPIACTVADDGQLYVVDGVHQAVLVYDKGERFLGSYSLPKLKPGAIAAFGDRLYLSDLQRQQVVILNRRTCKEIGAVGSVGDGDGQFRLPVGVALDRAGNLYVSDMIRCCVQKFTGDGAFLAKVGEQGDQAGAFARPKHLAVDSDGIVYVVDAAFQNVQMFNDKFQLLMHFGAAGDFPGSMNLPAGIAVTDSGMEYFKDRLHPGFEAKRLVVVANQFGDGKVSVYALGDRRASYALADLRANGAEVKTGVAEPTAEMLKFQNIGGVEPPPEGDSLETPSEGAKGAKPAAKPGESKPATPTSQPK